MEIKDVEIVREGKFNGAKVSSKLLNKWVQDFQENEKEGYYPTFHIGHNKEGEDDKPADGFITKMYKKGKRLYANLKPLDESFVDRIKKVIVVQYWFWELVKIQPKFMRGNANRIL